MRIAAEVARAWFEATGAREELRAQRATVATLHQTLELMRGRAALGDVAGADVDATHERWAAANALLQGIEARQRAAVLGLGALAGSQAERTLTLLDDIADRTRACRRKVCHKLVYSRGRRKINK